MVAGDENTLALAHMEFLGAVVENHLAGMYIVEGELARPVYTAAEIIIEEAVENIVVVENQLHGAGIAAQFVIFLLCCHKSLRLCHEVTKKNPNQASQTLSLSFGEFRREDGHGAFLGADVSRGAHGQRMGLRNAFTLEYRRYEGGGERVAGSYGISYFDLWRGLERHIARGEYVAAIDAAGEDEHLKIIFSEKDPALVLKVDAGISEHAAYRYQLLVVDLQNVAALHRVAEYLLGIETLTEVNVKYYEAVVIVRHSVEEAVYGIARYHVALGKGAEAYGLCILGKSFEPDGIGYIVPGHILLYFILGNAGGVNLYLHGACGVGHLGQELVEALGCEILHYLPAERVVAYGAHHTRGEAELRHMICEVCGCAAYFLTFGKNVPQGFSHAYYIVFHD